MRPVPSPPEVPSPQVQPEVPAPQMGCAQLALRLAWYAAGPLALVGGAAWALAHAGGR